MSAASPQVSVGTPSNPQPTERSYSSASGTSKEPRSGERDPPEPPPDFAEEAAPKSSEFGTKKDAKEITGGGFDLIP
jgi:hypothetical protein